MAKAIFALLKKRENNSIYKNAAAIYPDQNTYLVIGHFMKDAVRQKSTRDAILDATDRLLMRNGYKKMTIDDLAAEVGIGKGSVYLHFRSKEDIASDDRSRAVRRKRAASRDDRRTRSFSF